MTINLTKAFDTIAALRTALDGRQAQHPPQLPEALPIQKQLRFDRHRKRALTSQEAADAEAEARRKAVAATSRKTARQETKTKADAENQTKRLDEILQEDETDNGVEPVTHQQSSPFVDSQHRPLMLSSWPPQSSGSRPFLRPPVIPSIQSSSSSSSSEQSSDDELPAPPPPPPSTEPPPTTIRRRQLSKKHDSQDWRSVLLSKSRSFKQATARRNKQQREQERTAKARAKKEVKAAKAKVKAKKEAAEEATRAERQAAKLRKAAEEAEGKARLREQKERLWRAGKSFTVSQTLEYEPEVLDERDFLVYLTMKGRGKGGA